MAIVTGTVTRYNLVGLREQLSDKIYDISPTDTPFISGCSKMKAVQTLFEWQTDALAAVDTNNAVLEGDDITTFPQASPTVRVGNYTQISRKLVIVSGTSNVVSKAGRNSEMAYRIAMRSAELKRDMEAIALSNQGGAAGSASVARKTAGLGAWVKTNTDLATDGADPVYTSGVPGAPRTDGTPRAFTETQLSAVTQACYNSGANPDTLMVGPYNKTVVSSTFNGIADRVFDLSNAAPKPMAAISAIDVYVHDFGRLSVVPNRFQRGRDAWLLDFSFLGIAHLRPFQTVALAKTGDAEKRMLLVEWGLLVGQEAALGLVADLTTAAP